MTKSYSILQAKLQELESILDELLLLDPDTQSLSKDIIKQKLDFIGNLLSAEVASHPSKPHHLHHISQKLAALDKFFHAWDASRTFPHEEFDKDSSCSCTESCLNDDGEALGLVPEFVGDKALVEFNGEKETAKIFDKMGSFDYEDAEDYFEGDKQLVEFDRDQLKREETRDGAFGRKCCALLGGIVIGMVLMGFITVVNLFDCFHYVEHTSFTIPT